MLDPHHRDRVVEVVEQPVDRRPLVADDQRERHQPEHAALCGECPELVVGEVALDILHRATARMAADDVTAGREQLVGRRRRRVRQVEHDAALHELVHERTTRVGEPLVGRVEAARGPGRAVPREPGHPHPRVPPLPEPLGHRLDALEREHQPDPPVPPHLVEVVGRQDREDVVGVLGQRPLPRVAERHSGGAVLARGTIGGEDRAHLERDAAGPELRQPVPRERVLLVAAQARARAAGRCARRRSRARRLRAPPSSRRACAPSRGSRCAT